MIGLPVAYLQYLAALGAALLCLEMIRQIFWLFSKKRDGEVETV
jgi:hypothetical protein